MRLVEKILSSGLDTDVKVIMGHCVRIGQPLTVIQYLQLLRAEVGLILVYVPAPLALLAEASPTS